MLAQNCLKKIQLYTNAILSSMVERDNIENLSFSCTMLADEAKRRLLAAGQVNGATFRASTDPRFPERIVGTTTATDLPTLNRLNELLKSPQILDEDPTS